MSNAKKKSTGQEKLDPPLRASIDTMNPIRTQDLRTFYDLDDVKSNQC